VSLQQDRDFTVALAKNSIRFVEVQQEKQRRPGRLFHPQAAMN
jgi:hypothetical protein